MPLVKQNCLNLRSSCFFTCLSGVLFMNVCTFLVPYCDVRLYSDFLYGFRFYLYYLYLFTYTGVHHDFHIMVGVTDDW